MTTLIARAAEALFLRARKEGGTDAATLDEAGPEMRRWLEGHVRMLLEVMREPGDVGSWPNYLAGEWSRRNLEAFLDDALAVPEEGREP